MTEFHLVASYQHHENYGAHNWDGEGECPQHWKAKGGSDESLAVLTAAEVTELGQAGLQAIVDRDSVAWFDDYREQYVIGWELVCVDTDLLVRVRDGLVEAREDWGRDDPYLYMAVAIDLRISETAAKLAMAKLAEGVELPVEEVDSPWEDYADAA